MMEYLAMASVALVAIALAGIIVDRRFMAVMLATELMFIASSVLLVSFFSFASAPGPDAAVMLIGIWAVAAAEVIGMVTLYFYMRSQGLDSDLTKLSRLRW
jgi:NADH:ubiquinone oxidoreductase subunit K